jgi:hypothetical protein
MILRFPYLEEPLHGPPPPSLAPAAQRRWRPLIPVTISGPPARSAFFPRALLDSGADDTVFPLDVAAQLGLSLLPATGHAMRWRGQHQPLRYGQVVLELADAAGNLLRWPAVIAFTPVNLRYPLLGVAGCLEFLDARFLGKLREVELEPTDALPSAASP